MKTTCQKRKKTLKFLEKVGTKYDSKEYRFRNYGPVMGQNVNPAILLRLDVLDKEFELKIDWTDPNSKY